MEDYELAQYDLVNWKTTANIGRNDEGKDRSNTSIVSLEFTFKRQTGFFILQVSDNFSFLWKASPETLFWIAKLREQLL